MSIPIEMEDVEELKKWGWGVAEIQEHCIFCNVKTRMWHTPTNNSVCIDCAAVKNVSDMKDARMNKQLLQQSLADLMAAPDFTLQTTRSAHIDKLRRDLSARRKVTIEALQAALAQPDQAPPECKTPEQKQAYAFGWFSACQLFKTAQPAPQIPAGMCLVPLPSSLLAKLWKEARIKSGSFTTLQTYMSFARAIEAAHNIKAQL